MKNMSTTKKVLLILVLGLVAAAPALAQQQRGTYRTNTTAGRGRSYSSSSHSSYNRWYDYDRELYFGFRLGLAIANVGSDDPSLDGGDSMTDINLGFAVGVQLTDVAPIYVESGLYYVAKGGKGYYGDQKFTYDLNYLELPAVIKYKHFFDNDLSLQPFLGAFVACGVGGKMKDYGSREASSSFSDDYFRRFDAGIKLGCGIAFQNFYFDMAYDFGLANISHDTFDTAHTGCFYLTLGVDF